MQGSIRWWGRKHRIHHRHVDTDKDPYNATRGFWYSHMGWMIMKQDPRHLGQVTDMQDFEDNQCVVFQNKYYLPIAIFSGVILPTLIAGFGWGDWFGGYFYAACAKIFFCHHSTFFINSLAHSDFLAALQPYGDSTTAHDSILCSFLTFGEGYHNFHHEFPGDYRNAIRWYQYDPTKWAILGLEAIGLAYNLNRLHETVIEHNKVNMEKKNHEEELAKIKVKLYELEKTDKTLP
jgi:stearoyl-CoA desaturase (delta-9 desaturase)